MRLPPLALAALLASGCAADAADEVGEASTVGPFEPVRGTSTLRAELVTGRSGDGYASSSRGGYGGVTNVLFYDVEAREGRWLFPDSERTVLESRALGDSARVRAFLYVVAEEDSDGDGAYGAGDVQAIAVSDAAGTRLVRLAEGVTRFRQSLVLDDDTVLVLYDEGGAVRALEVGLEGLDVEARASMPPAPRGGI